MSKLKSYKYYVLWAVLGSLWLWGLIFALRFICYAICIFLFCLSFTFIIKKDKQLSVFKWRNLPLFFCGAILLNMISCFINRKQSIALSFQIVEYLYLFYFLFFYVFVKSKISIINCEWLIKILFFSFALAYLLEYFVFFPKPVITPLYFEVREHRLRLYGQMIAFIGYFFFLNKLLCKEGNKIVNIVGIVLGLIIVTTLGFRSTLVATIVVSVFMIYKVQGRITGLFKSLFLFAILFIVVINTEFGADIINKMLERQETDNFDNSDYIRILEWNYYTTNHFLNGFDYFFGSGIPSDNSVYGKNMFSLASFNQYGEVTTSIAQWRDWGVIGFSWILGLPATIVLLLLIFIMIFANLDKRYMYIKCTYIFLFFISITTMEIFRAGAFVFHALSLYMIYRLKIERKL